MSMSFDWIFKVNNLLRIMYDQLCYMQSSHDTQASLLDANREAISDLIAQLEETNQLLDDSLKREKKLVNKIDILEHEVSSLVTVHYNLGQRIKELEEIKSPQDADVYNINRRIEVISKDLKVLVTSPWYHRIFGNFPDYGKRKGGGNVTKFHS